MMREPGIAGARFAAATLISRYGIEEPEQIELEDIAWDLGVRVKTAPLDGAEAWLLRRCNKGLIRVRAGLPELGRYRFAVAHELGHWSYHSGQSQAWVCSSQDIHAYWGSPAEIEANAFASELLMPKKLLGPRLQGAHLTIEFLRDLASKFNTTLTAAAVRVADETKDDCCVVFSEKNVVRWWRASQTSDFRLPSKFPVSNESWAFDCMREPGRTTGTKQVESSVWITQRHRDAEVWEELVLLGEYGTVLTLLCFG